MHKVLLDIPVFSFTCVVPSPAPDLGLFMTFCFKLFLSCKIFLLSVETDPISKSKLFYLFSLADFGGKSETNSWYTVLHKDQYFIHK